MKMARGVWPFNLSGTPTTAQSTMSSWERTACKKRIDCPLSITMQEESRLGSFLQFISNWNRIGIKKESEKEFSYDQSLAKVSSSSIFWFLHSWSAGRRGPKSAEQQSENRRIWDFCQWLIINNYLLFTISYFMNWGLLQKNFRFETNPPVGTFPRGWYVLQEGCRKENIPTVPAGSRLHTFHPSKWPGECALYAGGSQNVDNWG